jgi:hypothetical protein
MPDFNAGTLTKQLNTNQYAKPTNSTQLNNNSEKLYQSMSKDIKTIKKK